MRLVRRKYDQHNTSTTFQKKPATTYVTYVKPGAVKRGDVIVDPLEVVPTKSPPDSATGVTPITYVVSDSQLAELAEQYPDEFAAAAKERGVEPGHELHDDTKASELMALSAKELIKAIKELDEDDDAALLATIYEMETGDEGANRPTVVGALKQKGFGEDEA